MANGNGEPATTGQIKTAGIAMAIAAAALGAIGGFNLFILSGIRSDIASLRADVQTTKNLAYENQRSIATVEASRFTAKDGLEVWKAIHAIQADVTDHAADMSIHKQ